ncbi:MAG: hypothetical protein ABRQ37_05280 [Candidatus Eremiobacterota bacterium]
MILNIDYERAELVVSRLQISFTKRTGLLREVENLIENQLPDGVKRLSKEHALFLFYVIPNDYNMRSELLYERAKKLFKFNSPLFESAYILKHYKNEEDPDLITATAKYLGTRYPKETAKRWYINSEKLLKCFDGDPRNLFRSSSNATLLLNKIKTFRGYGDKTGGLLLRAVINLKFSEVTELYEVPQPVDIHDSRIAFYTRIIMVDANHKEDEINYYDYRKNVAEILLKTCKTLKVQWLDVDQALWLIGSRGCVKKRCSLCPLLDVCRVGSKGIVNGKRL